MASNRRDQIRMTDDELTEFLGGRHTMSVATFSPDGTIHLVAMWYGFFGDNLAFETYGKSQKVLNVQRDPRITVMIEDGDTYETLRGVEIVGQARVHDDGDTMMTVARSVVQRYFPIDDAADLDSVAAGLAAKRVAIEIVPDRVVSWDHNKL